MAFHRLVVLRRSFLKLNQLKLNFKHVVSVRRDKVNFVLLKHVALQLLHLVQKFLDRLVTALDFDTLQVIADVAKVLQQVIEASRIPLNFGS